MKDYRNPVHRKQVLQRVRLAERDIFGPHTQQERDDLFRQLQRPDLPPSPQLDWIEAHPA